MATIASNVSLGGGAASTNAPSDNAPADGSSPDDFMQLVNGMIQGNTPGELVPANLLQLLLTGDTGGLDGVMDAAATKDGDSSDTSDDDGSEAAASELAMLLAGLQTAQSLPATDASGGDSTGVSALGAAGSQKGEQAQLAAAQAALGGALESALDGASGANGSAGKDAAAAGVDPNALNSTNNATNGAAHLQNTLLAHRAADMAPQAASAEVRTPVGAQGWSDEIGNHLAIMAANGRETASLRLSPEHLGPLEIQISVKDGQTNVVFGASSPETRNALEQSLPRLREMFASQGLTLGNANVSRDTPRDSRPSPFAKGSRGSSDASADISVKGVTLTRMGLVDTYV
ncbi:MAG: flagellar hook-length control protein FliK [Gammaproteobacteria bacterium]